MFIPSIGREARLTLIPGIPYGRADTTSLLLDLVLPENAKNVPVTIWLHGGGWYAGSRADGPTYWCATLAAHGIAVAAVDYRLSGDAPFPAQIHDIKAAIRWLRANADQYGINAGRIGIWGHSAGGHLAALAALTGDVPALEGNCGTPGVSTRVQAAAVASCNSDFGGWWSPENAWVIEHLFDGRVNDLAGPVNHVSRDAPPFLIAHGTRDETVPFDQATRLRDALESVGVPVEFVPIDGGYHNWSRQPDATWPKVRYVEFADLAREFFQRTIR
jgi:acetyl esterase/lipase